MRISDGREHPPPITIGVRELEWLPFHVVSKYLQCLFDLVTKHDCDEWTDRQNYDSQD